MTTQIIETKDKKPYFYVLKDGLFHKEVEEGTEGATKREYENKDGVKAVKWEKSYEKISGLLTNISIIEGDFGRILQLTIGDDLVISLSASQNFAEDVMKKMPNIDITRDVCFSPFSFMTENGKQKRGMTITQGEQKIQNYYSKKEGEKWVNINGYPVVPPEAETWKAEEWKVYFGQARIFLMGEIKKHKLYDVVKSEDAKAFTDYPTEDIKPEDIPF